jgi:hypothetical protein
VVFLAEFEVFLVVGDAVFHFFLDATCRVYKPIFLIFFLLLLNEHFICVFVFVFDFLQLRFFVAFFFLHPRGEFHFFPVAPEIDHLIEDYKLLANFECIDIHHFSFDEFTHQMLLPGFWLRLPNIFVDLSCMDTLVQIPLHHVVNDIDVNFILLQERGHILITIFNFFFQDCTQVFQFLNSLDFAHLFCIHQHGIFIQVPVFQILHFVFF